MQTGFLKQRRTWMIGLAIALTLTCANSYSGESKIKSSSLRGPGFNKIVRVIEMEPVPSSSIDYIDQSAMDAMGVQIAPGRVGLKDFNQSAAKTFAYEIKVNAKYRNAFFWSKKLKTDYPELFVEDDIAGGAGRAGFIEVAPRVWVNKKGPGKTGVGRSAELIGPRVPTPPLEIYVSNADGGLLLSDGMMETIWGRIVDSEFRSGGSRVVSLIRTGRTRVNKFGITEQLVTVDRTIVKRLGGNVANGLTNESLAEGNAKRFMKGDFLNGDNMGKEGEWIDYGCMSHTCSHIPAASSENQHMYSEGSTLDFQDTNLYEQAFGKNLLNQTGIPESHIQRIMLYPQVQEEVRNFGHHAIQLKSMKLFDDRNPIFRGRSNFKDVVRISTEPLTPEELTPFVDFNAFYRDAAGNFFSRGNLSLTDIGLAEKKRLRLLLNFSNPSEELLSGLDRYVDRLHQLYFKIEAVNPITKVKGYGEKLRQIAQFKNRENNELLRSKLFKDIHEFIRAHNGNPTGEEISNFIEDRVMSNRFTTAPVSDANFITRADHHSADIFIRAHSDAQGTKSLFQYPELTHAKAGEQFWFDVSTDGGKLFKNIPGEFVPSNVGEYFKIQIPHGSMPVTDARILIIPKIKKITGEVEVLKDGFQLKGPTLLLNERLGLPADMTRRSGYVRSKLSQKTSIWGSDLPGAEGVVSDKEPIMNLIRDLSAYPDSTVQYELSLNLKAQAEKVRLLYLKDEEFREFVDELIADMSSHGAPLEKELRKIISAKPNACGIWNFLRAI